MVQDKSVESRVINELRDVEKDNANEVVDAYYALMQDLAFEVGGTFGAKVVGNKSYEKLYEARLAVEKLLADLRNK